MGASVNIRAFLAIPLAELFHSELEPFINGLKQRYPTIRWLPPRAVHLTLHFLGSVSMQQIEKLSYALQPCLEKVSSFEIFLEGMGAFPNFRNSRIFWVGCGGKVVNLKQVQALIEKILQGLDFPHEEHPFLPHATIGRLKAGKPPNGIEKIHFAKTSPRMIKEIVLFQSHLTPQGSEYEPLRRYAFKTS